MHLWLHLMEQRALGRRISKVEIIRRWSVCGQEIPKDALAHIISVSVPVMDGVLDLIEAHPDWGDEEVTNEASWR